MSRPLDYPQRKGFRFGRVYSDAEHSTLGAMAEIHFASPEVKELLFKVFEEGMQFANDEHDLEALGHKAG